MPASTPQDLKAPILRRTRRLILEHGWNSTAYQILNPGLQRWFTPQGDAVVGFVRASRYRVVAGSPVCAADRLADVVALFEEDTRRAGLHSCYFAADERLAVELRQRGPLDRILLGAQPVWDPAEWSRIVAAKASLRAQIHRARNKGVKVTEWDAERATGSPELRRCLHDWLETRGLPPLHFLVEPETLARLYDRRVFVAEHRRRVTAFLVASPIPRRRGWLIEQTVREPDTPNGTGEMLLDFTMRQLARARARYVTLGLSPLSRRSHLPSPSHPWWIRTILRTLRAYGRRFYDFDGLDAYKAKFVPQRWEPIYAITSERRIGIGTLWAIAEAFARTPPPVLLLQALLRVARRQALSLRRRRATPPDLVSHR